ncbi:BON domain-containing protein [Frankia sp. QA3]|uniref:BON domain-containing protein n=1 Tax=Frankia sp. QA3 TaxID=710111 RepID=UPI000305A6AD|nr:BON domain-containing protein [Frankia sp. QA3]
MTLKEADIPFALGGSYACWARGGPEPVHDVDFMLREEDVPRAVEVLAAAGLRPVDPPEDWLTKVFDGEVLVDLIHHPVGRAVTQQTLERSSEMSVDSVRMPVLDATDWFEMTLLALEERYCDLARVLPMIRAMREQVDWDQVRRSTAASPFAEAALLVATRLNLIPPADPAPAAARPGGIALAGAELGDAAEGDAAKGSKIEGSAPEVRVPERNGPTGSRAEGSRGEGTGPQGSEAPGWGAQGSEAPGWGAQGSEAPGWGAQDRGAQDRGTAAAQRRGAQDGRNSAAPGARPGWPDAATAVAPPPGAQGELDLAEADEYLAGELHERLAEDPRVAELGLEVVVADGRILVEGEVATDARRRAVADVLAEAAPGRPVRNEVTITGHATAADEPANVETIS